MKLPSVWKLDATFQNWDSKSLNNAAWYFHSFDSEWMEFG